MGVTSCEKAVSTGTNCIGSTVGVDTFLAHAVGLLPNSREWLGCG